ncbi:carboxypeptidase regulatory-like domain-containing protein [Candidatus Sumerlaeota bacterium]|nr:carboxypeptidase regulatory-like domain-containing protein [Candidatus Sumerlaeota bacterium]
MISTRWHHFILVLLVLLVPLYLPAQPTPEPTIQGETVMKSLLVKGMARSQIGEPASDVTVLLEIQDMRSRRRIGNEATKTAADGAFEFNLDKYSDVPRLGLMFTTLSRHHQGVTKISIVTHDQFPLNIDLELREGSVARGRVVDDAEKPVADAQVSAGDARAVKTDSDGNFELLGLPLAGRFLAVAAKKGYSDGSAEFSIDPDRETDGIVVRLNASAKLTGRALTPDDKPIDSGEVTVYVGTLYQRTRLKQDGTFEFVALPVNLDELTILFRTDRFLPVERKFTDEEKASRNVTLKVEWPLHFAGTVRDPEGKPRPGAGIIVGDNVKQRAIRFNADDKGEWKAGPFPMGEQMTFTATGANPSAHRASGELQFTVEEKPDEWKAQVKPWPNGCESTFSATVRGLEITMTRTDVGPGALPGTVSYTGTIDADLKAMKGTLFVPATGAKGEFTATAYNPSDSLRGVWDLRESIGRGKWIEAPVQQIVMSAPFSGTQLLDLQLAAPLKMTGVVKMEDGSPLPTGTVSLYRWNNSEIIERSAPITAGGKFTLEGLPKGVLQVFVRDEKNQPLTNPVFLRGGLDHVELHVGARPPDPMEPIRQTAK